MARHQESSSASPVLRDRCKGICIPLALRIVCAQITKTAESKEIIDHLVSRCVWIQPARDMPCHASSTKPWRTAHSSRVHAAEQAMRWRGCSVVRRTQQEDAALGLQQRQSALEARHPRLRRNTGWYLSRGCFCVPLHRVGSLPHRCMARGPDRLVQQQTRPSTLM